jgi:hypothetical protein
MAVASSGTRFNQDIERLRKKFWRVSRGTFLNGCDLRNE